MVNVPVEGGQAGLKVPESTYVLPEHPPGVAVNVPQVGAVYVTGVITGAPGALKTAETAHCAPLPQTGAVIE